MNKPLEETAGKRLNIAYPVIFVTDVARTVDFYRSKLGFKVDYAYGEPPFYAMMTRDGASLHFRQVDRIPMERTEEDLLATAISVAGVEALFREFAEQAVNFHQMLKTQPWGTTDFIVRDLDGNLLCFSEARPYRRSVTKAPERESILQTIVDLILALPNDHVVRVAIDGVDGAGKTTFADEIAPMLVDRGRPIIRASVDGFHHPKTIRYRLGRASPKGFFRDSYDYAALKKKLLDPLSPGGSGRYHRAIFDVSCDSPVLKNEEVAQAGSIVVFDGIFLHRPELQTYWDFSIFLDVAFEVSIPRGAQRGPGFGSSEPEAVENHRYVGGQKLYFKECQPQKYASIIIDNNDLTSPRIVAVADGSSDHG